MAFSVVAAVLISVFWIAYRYPDLPAGRALGKFVVYAESAFRNASPARLAIWILIIAGTIFVARVAIDLKDGLVLLQAIPEAISWFIVFDVAIYFEVFAAILLARTMVGVRFSLHAFAKVCVALRMRGVAAIRGRSTARRERAARSATQRNETKQKDDPDGHMTLFGLNGLPLAA